MAFDSSFGAGSSHRARATAIRQRIYLRVSCRCMSALSARASAVRRTTTVLRCPLGMCPKQSARARLDGMDALGAKTDP